MLHLKTKTKIEDKMRVRDSQLVRASLPVQGEPGIDFHLSLVASLNTQKKKRQNLLLLLSWDHWSPLWNRQSLAPLSPASSPFFLIFVQSNEDGRGLPEKLSICCTSSIPPMFCPDWLQDKSGVLLSLCSLQAT